MLVPDFVIALTIVPLDPPCVASNRFDDELELRDRVAAVLGLAEAAGLVLRDAQAVHVQLKRAEAAQLVRRGVLAAADGEHREVDEVAAVERQLLHLSRIHVAAERGADRVDERRRPGDGHRFLSVAGAISKSTTAVCPTSSSTRRPAR